MTTITEKRKDTETRESVNKLLNSFEDAKSKRYWLKVMVKAGRISEMRAGQIIVEKGL